VIVALMGAGLKLHRRIGWRTWNVTWRLWYRNAAHNRRHGSDRVVGSDLPVASALLIAAALAPTDPVLASDVQIGPRVPLRRTMSAF